MWSGVCVWVLLRGVRLERKGDEMYIMLPTGRTHRELCGGGSLLAAAEGLAHVADRGSLCGSFSGEAGDHVSSLQFPLESRGLRSLFQKLRTNARRADQREHLSRARLSRLATSASTSRTNPPRGCCYQNHHGNSGWMRSHQLAVQHLRRLHTLIVPPNTRQRC